MAVGVAGLSVLLFWGRSCFRPSAPREVLVAASSASTGDPPAIRSVPARPPAAPARQSAPAATPAAAPDEAALDEALGVEDPILRSLQFGRLFSAVIGRNPAAALAYLEHMDRGGNEYTLAMFALLKDVGQRDPRRALALAKQLAVTSEHRVVYNVLFDQFAAVRAADAVPLLESVPGGEARINAVRALSIRWADQDIESALAWAQQLGNAEDRGPAVESVLFGMAESEPWRAFALAAQNLDGDALERTVAQVFRQLKAIDPDTAADFFRGLPADGAQAHILLDIARLMADRDPTAALEWSGSLPAGELQQLALNNVLDVWLAKSPGMASDYVSTMPRGKAQAAAAAHLAERLAVTDAAAAVEFARGLKNASARQAASIAVASGWARQDSAAATRWAVGLGEDDSARAEAMDAALSYWVLTDSAAAVRYVRRLAAGKIQDDGFDALSRLMAVQRPELAVDLAASIGNARLRNMALVEAFGEWRARDPSAAATWLAESELSAAVRRRLQGD